MSPDIKFSPKRVVEIQLKALQINDVPSPDFGILQTWLFAHPENKIVTGPIQRFTAMIKSPNYKTMLNHIKHTIEPVILAEDLALFDVSIITSERYKASFQWEVSKVSFGPHEGAWMTTSVSPPLRAKDAI